MAKIIGLGEWFPNKIRINSDWSKEIVEAFKASRQRELVDVFDDNNSNIDLYSKAGFQSEANDPFMGTKERRIAESHIPSSLAEAFAGEEAIAQAGIKAKDIGAVYSWAAIPDIPSLNSAPWIARQVGADNAFAFGLEGACTSALAQLIIASALVDSGQVKYVLLTQSHLITRAIPMAHPASPNVGDAATAILVGPNSEKGHMIYHTYARSHGEYCNAVVLRRRTGDQSWYLPGEGFSLGSFASHEAKELVQKTVTLGAQTVYEALLEKGKTFLDLNYFISVQPRKWVPSAIAQTMGLSSDKTIETFDKYAHLGGCGPVVNLIEASRQNKLNKGDLVGIYAQGAGFSRSAALIYW